MLYVDLNMSLINISKIRKDVEPPNPPQYKDNIPLK